MAKKKKEKIKLSSAKDLYRASRKLQSVWSRTIKEAFAYHQLTGRIQLQVDEDELYTLLSSEDIQIWESGEFMEQVMDAYLRTVLLKYLLEGEDNESGLYFDKFMDADHVPAVDYVERVKAESYSGETRTGQHAELSEDLAEDDVEYTSLSVSSTGDMMQGFQVLRSALSKRRVAGGKGVVHGGIGPRAQVMRLKLSPYMPVGAAGGAGSKLNSLFYGVEFGTGIAANVGGAQNVRYSTSIPYKVHGPGSLPGQPEQNTNPRTRGAWWFGGSGSQDGYKVYGQKGFHFLYDARSRTPVKAHEDFIRRTLPAFFARRLRAFFLGE